MSDGQTTSFPTMGEDWIGQLINVSGAPSSYTKPVARKNVQSGDVPGTGGMKTKGQGTVIRNANGPACKIVATIAYPNAEGANQTLRNLRRVRPGGTGGFYGGVGAAGNASGV